MNLFKSSEPAAPAPETGLMVLRKTVKARGHRAGGYHAIVRECKGLSISALEDFADSKAELPRPLLQLIAKELYDAALDDNDMLYKLNPPPVRSLGVRPEPYQPPPDFVMPRPTGVGPQPLTPSKVETTTKRDGWAGDFFSRRVEQPVVRSKPPERFVRLRERD